MEESLYRLVYVSSALPPVSTGDLERLLESARARNQAQSITGVLLFSGGNFMQVLEGRRDVVRSVFERIRRNPAHHQVIELMGEPVRQREFAGWSMAFSYANWQKLQQVQHAIKGRGGEGMELLSSFWGSGR